MISAARDDNRMSDDEAQVTTLDRDAMLGELHAWAKSWLDRAKENRRANWESNWRIWQRNSDSVYDPALAKRKETWQSKAVWPMTASHRESAQAQLFKTEVGPRPPLDVKARKGIIDPNIPGMDQSDNIRDLVLREREKSEYEVNRNSVLEDKTTYGSGFAQVYFDTDIQDRLVWEQEFEPVVDPAIDGGASVQRSVAGQLQPIGRKQVVRPQVIYRGIRFRHISIWDVFLDPRALKIQGSGLPVAIRYSQTYEQILEGAKPTPEGGHGWVLPEAVIKLKDQPSMETTPIDKTAVRSDRKLSDVPVVRTEQQKNFECYEIQVRLPKKWVLIDGQDIDDPEALMPAILRYHDHCVIGVFPSQAYDGEPDIYKDDYMPRALQPYGVGIPEMLKDAQAVATETINQRLDSGAISLKKVFAVIEKSAVDSKDFDNWANGSTIRLKGRDGLTNIDQLFKQLDMSPPDRAAFVEPQEWERVAQERTSITQTTLGTEDNSDTTLGAQKIQQGVTGTKIAYLGMLSEFDFQRKVFAAYYKNIYLNYTPEDYALALGQERAATVVPPTPEQMNSAYTYTPLGIFEMENKAQRSAQISNWVKTYGMAPWANVLGAAKEDARVMDIDESKLILQDAEAIQITDKASQMAQGMAQQMVAESGQMSGQKSAPGGPQ